MHCGCEGRIYRGRIGYRPAGPHQTCCVALIHAFAAMTVMSACSLFVALHSPGLGVISFVILCIMHARAHLFISGRVQGVNYRAFTRDVANRLGLRGWVRNLPDGGVEALFEGNKEDIEQAIQRCFSGPPAARVDDIDVRWEDYQGDIREFQVRFY